MIIQSNVSLRAFPWFLLEQSNWLNAAIRDGYVFLTGKYTDSVEVAVDGKGTIG